MSHNLPGLLGVSAESWSFHLLSVDTEGRPMWALLLLPKSYEELRKGQRENLEAWEGT